jgi:hypothetical protein
MVGLRFSKRELYHTVVKLRIGSDLDDFVWSQENFGKVSSGSAALGTFQNVTAMADLPDGPVAEALGEAKR